MKEYLEKSSKILDELQTTEQGLSEAEAARRLSEHGPNRLAAGKKKSNLQRFFEELKDPMILILLAAALISGITSAYEGESYADVVIILTVVIINAVLGVLQESKAEKAIEDPSSFICLFQNRSSGRCRPCSSGRDRPRQDRPAPPLSPHHLQ